MEGGIPITMPHQDLTITKATVMRWLVEKGDAVKSGQAVVEVETDKALTEVEAPADGVLAQVTAPEGTVVNLGDPLGILM
jgi:2-oxoisovalerate dehydrogenase E1 component